MADYDQVADDLQAKVRKQNWKLGGALSMDCDEAAEAIAAALRAAHAAGVAVERERCAGITDGTPHAAQLALLGDDIDDEYRAEYEAEIEIRNILTAAIRKGE